MLMATDKEIKKFAAELKSLFGDKIDRIILYGSYSRDDEVPGSDIDIAVILTELESGDRKKVQEMTEKWFQDTDLRFSPRLFDKDDFERNVKEGYSFHKNVEKEGVEL